MLIFSKSPLFLWAEAVATACYTQNQSLIHTRYDKTPYELLKDRKLELKYLHIFEGIPDLQQEDQITNGNNELTHMASAQHGSGPNLQDKDAPSLSISPNNETSSPPINSTNVEPNEEVVEFNMDTFTNLFAPPKTSSAESSLQIVDT
ncbi:hypothetical protein Tco_0136907 [Tanacetum coccineum]